MAELKTVRTAASVEKFFAAVDDEQTRKDCRALVKMMTKATGARPAMWGSSIVGFGDYRYRYPNGREAAWFLAGFSPRKRDLTLYLMGGIDGRKSLLDKLGRHKTGRACLSIRRLADVDPKVLQALIDQSIRDLKD
jgi:hypothetical protein